MSSSTDLAAFAEVVGHDLAQPLQVAYGYLELLRSDHRDALDATAASWLDAAVDSLERMRVLVHGVLGFARSGLRAPDPVDVDLAAVLDDVVARLPLPATTGDWQLRRGALPVVRGDREHLTTVVSELLDNARRFGADGVVVEVSAEATPEGWTVTVADDGPGLPAALDERAFEPFERGPTSSPRGPGLGLAVCRTLVEAHGGRIWSERGAGSGAVIRFSLPSDRVRPSATPHLTSDG